MTSAESSQGPRCESERGTNADLTPRLLSGGVSIAREPTRPRSPFEVARSESLARGEVSHLPSGAAEINTAERQSVDLHAILREPFDGGFSDGLVRTVGPR